MLLIVGYWVATFFLAVGVGLIIRWRTRRLRGALAVTVTLAILVVGASPYLRVEWLTEAYGTELKQPAVSATEREFLGIKVRFFRVLRASEDEADVYVVVESDENRTGNLIHLRRQEGRWQAQGDVDVLWSDYGSAHGMFFPPYPGQGDFSGYVPHAVGQ